MSNALLLMEKNPSAKDLLAQNLRYAMLAREWTERDLAKKSGIAQKTINNLLNQRTSASLDSIEQIARAFGISATDLVSPVFSIRDSGAEGLDPLIRNYRQASTEGRQILLQLSQREADRK